MLADPLDEANLFGRLAEEPSDVLCHEVRLARLSAKLIVFLELVSGVGVRTAFATG
jgi:hypothetical protein